MLIVPNTTIRILKDVPLDNTYKDTIYFNSRSAQQTYFIGKTKHTLTNYTYQRQTKSIRVGINSENLFDCNYIMFQNTNFGTKWFYAFITGVEYVNNGVSDVTFEIDVMQTWFYDCTLKPSFVEREHSVTDNIGDNIVDEKLELGDYVHKNATFTGLLSDYKIVVASTFKKSVDGLDLVDVGGRKYSNIFSGLYFSAFDTIDGVVGFLELVNQKGKVDGVVSVFMMPSAFIPMINGTIQSETDVVKINYSRPKNTTTLDGYTPKNKKLYTYPYNFLLVTNGEGEYAELHYEDFSTDDCQFELAGDVSCNPQVMLTPKNYRGQSLNYNEKLILDKFPQCAYNTDSYKAWLAQNSSSLRTSVGAGVLSQVAGVATGNTVLALGGVVAVANTLSKIRDKSVLPNQAHGTSGSGIQNALRIKDFRFSHATIKKEHARIIDEYFSMYGYATHRVKVPNISSRPHWNYVKTIDVNIVGSIPVDSMSKIKSIFDKGVTFWKNGDNVGNYNLDNSV